MHEFIMARVSQLNFRPYKDVHIKMKKLHFITLNYILNYILYLKLFECTLCIINYHNYHTLHSYITFTVKLDKVFFFFFEKQVRQKLISHNLHMIFTQVTHCLKTKTPFSLIIKIKYLFLFSFLFQVSLSRAYRYSSCSLSCPWQLFSSLPLFSFSSPQINC